MIVWFFFLGASAFAFVPNDFDVCNFIDLLSKRDRPNAIQMTAAYYIYYVGSHAFGLSKINFSINANW